MENAIKKIKDIKYLNDLLSLLKKHYVKSSFKFKSSNKSFSVDSTFISSNIMNNIHNYNKVYECNLPNIDCIIFTKHLTNKVKLDIQLMINRFNTMINFFEYNDNSFNKNCLV